GQITDPRNFCRLLGLSGKAKRKDYSAQNQPKQVSLHCSFSRLSTYRLRLSNDSVRPRQHIRRYRKADLLRSLKVDDELKLRRLLHRKICWFSALQNLVHVGSSPPPQVHHIRRIGHEPSVLHILYLVVYRRQPALCRQFYNLCSVDKEDRTAQQEKS